VYEVAPAVVVTTGGSFATVRLVDRSIVIAEDLSRVAAAICAKGIIRIVNEQKVAISARILTPKPIRGI
jgi:aspartokinase-like uncharacterized kinase